MGNQFTIQLTPSEDQLLRLDALQQNFIEVCNAIYPVVQASRCWNRVVLHHMVYHKMRAQFPNTGSQMICNCIYAVCQVVRLVFQHPKSPWNINQQPNQLLPKIIFLPQSPVYFDRHTLDLKGSILSLYTLDGRLKFNLNLTDFEQKTFQKEKLKTVLLVKNQEGFSLHFHFTEMGKPHVNISSEIPDNVLVIQDQYQYNLQSNVMKL